MAYDPDYDIDQPEDPRYWVATLDSSESVSAIVPSQQQAEEIAKIFALSSQGERFRVMRDAGVLSTVYTTPLEWVSSGGRTN